MSSILRRRSITIKPSLMRELEKYARLRDKEKCTSGKFSPNAAMNEAIVNWIEWEKAKRGNS